MSKGIFLVAILGLLGAGQAADSLVVFKAGDTAKAAAVNANFMLLWERMSSLAAENLRLVKKIDSLENDFSRTADSVRGMAASLAGKANASHAHPVSQVAGLQDSLKARVVAKDGPLRVCTGSTDPKQIWEITNEYAIYIDINTAACGFTATPLYFTSLAAKTGIGTTTGATSVHRPTPTGFRIHVAHQPWAANPARPSQDWEMQINWVAMGQ